MLRNIKFIIMAILFSVNTMVFPSIGDASLGLKVNLTPYHPVKPIQLESLGGFNIIRNKTVYKLGDTPLISKSYIFNLFNLMGVEGFGVIKDGTPYAFQLFSPVEIKMPTVEHLYERYGYNRAVRKSLYFYKRDKKAFAKRLHRAGRYIDKMAEIFVEMGIPPELSYLPLIESGFKLHAYSPKRAAGPWQFIPATAKKYGLKIDWWVDERRDPIKSTIAAAKYLSDLYEKFRDWNLALAAYNAGEGRIVRAIRKIRKRDYWRIRKTKFINRETKNYVPSFIAATAIALEPERFGFYGVESSGPLEYDLVEIETPIDLAVVARFTGTTISEIKELNPELRRWCTPPNVSTYTLRIPVGTKEVFLANLSNASDEELLYVKLHKVKPGETVGKIARKLGTSIQAIIDLNSLGKEALIIAGKTILIPVDRELHELAEKTSNLRPILKGKKL